MKKPGVQDRRAWGGTLPFQSWFGLSDVGVDSVERVVGSLDVQKG
jgi:hypothetical protein